MKHISRQRFTTLQKKVSTVSVAILGDLMIDRYFWGNVNRISPEAPVPIVEVQDEAIRMGGAANCANNILMLGARVVPIGVTGDDLMGRDFLELLRTLGISTAGIVMDAERQTTVKTRIIASGQQLVRIDRESRNSVSAETETRIIEILGKLIPEVDAIILQDYNKGLLTVRIIDEAIRLGLAHGKLITVDPKIENFFRYRQVTVFKPNQREAETALGYTLSDERALHRGLHELQDRLQSRNVLITRGEKGLALLETDGVISLVPTKALEVADVSGAGDTVISTLTCFLAAGACPKEAAAIANQAAGIVVAEAGVVPIRMDQLAGIYTTA